MHSLMDALTIYALQLWAKWYTFRLIKHLNPRGWFIIFNKILCCNYTYFLWGKVIRTCTNPAGNGSHLADLSFKAIRIFNSQDIMEVFPWRMP